MPTDVVAASFGAVIVAMALAGVAALILRVRHAQDRRRFLPVLAAAVAVAAVVDTAPPDGLPLLGVWLQAVTLPLLPATTAVSIFRYRLFDIEVLIRRTVVYVVVTGVLLGGYLAVALAAVRLAGEVQTSRERLVIAREEERRRLRRDLHDGLGPGLATIASNVEITARAEPGRLFLEIRDDGRGLPHPVVEGVGSGSMRERAAELGGTLRRTSSPGKGTIVEAVLPL